ncbi:arsenate reductase [Reinekea sp.]|jgi:arsenate reductase|uniref:arsenate reductase n=2 Tax=Reinekea sp. TaxID=1970455 RepID=UPI00398952F6
MIKIFGIKNCDTMKKTFKWFDAHNVDYQFVDYKKEAPTQALAEQFLGAHPWETIINKRGTTWRKLDEATKDSMDNTNAIEIMMTQPSIIKRPIVVSDKTILVGFDEAAFKKLI